MACNFALSALLTSAYMRQLGMIAGTTTTGGITIQSRVRARVQH